MKPLDELLREMREAAEKATSGEWRTGSPSRRCKTDHGRGPRGHGQGDCVYEGSGWQESQHEIFVDEEILSHPQDKPIEQPRCIAGAFGYEDGGIVHENDTPYIALCSPANVLRILNAIDTHMQVEYARVQAEWSEDRQLLDKRTKALEVVIRHLPDARRDAECWDWCWDALDDAAQDEVQAARAQGREALKEEADGS